MKEKTPCDTYNGTRITSQNPQQIVKEDIFASLQLYQLTPIGKRKWMQLFSPTKQGKTM